MRTDDGVHDRPVLHAKKVFGKQLPVDFYPQTVVELLDCNLPGCGG
jgi:hypothetical protein